MANTTVFTERVRNNRKERKPDLTSSGCKDDNTDLKPVNRQWLTSVMGNYDGGGDKNVILHVLSTTTGEGKMHGTWHNLLNGIIMLDVIYAE